MLSFVQKDIKALLLTLLQGKLQTNKLKKRLSFLGRGKILLTDNQ